MSFISAFSHISHIAESLRKDNLLVLLPKLARISAIHQSASRLVGKMDYQEELPMEQEQNGLFHP